MGIITRQDTIDLKLYVANTGGTASHFLARFDFLLSQRVSTQEAAHIHLTGWYRIAALAVGASSAL